MLEPESGECPEKFLPSPLRQIHRFDELDARWKPDSKAVRRLRNNCRGITPELKKCVMWRGAIAHGLCISGPKFYLNRHQVSLRRMMHLWFVGPLDSAKGKPTEWTTICGKNLCINPIHLKRREELQKEQDKVGKKRKRKEKDGRLISQIPERPLKQQRKLNDIDNRLNKKDISPILVGCLQVITRTTTHGSKG